MGGLKKLMEVVNNFIGIMSHSELVAFSQAQPVITADVCKLVDLILPSIPDFRRISGACLQNDSCAACVSRAVQKHLVGTNFNKMPCVLGSQLRGRTYTKYQSRQGRAYVSVHMPIRHP